MWRWHFRIKILTFEKKLLYNLFPNLSDAVILKMNSILSHWWLKNGTRNSLVKLNIGIISYYETTPCEKRTSSQKKMFLDRILLSNKSYEFFCLKNFCFSFCQVRPTPERLEHAKLRTSSELFKEFFGEGWMCEEYEWIIFLSPLHRFSLEWKQIKCFCIFYFSAVSAVVLNYGFLFNRYAL